MKDTRFIISMKSCNGKITVENNFEIDGKEATFGDIPTNDKYNICEAIKQSLGALAKITMIEMQAQMKKNQ